MKKISLAPLIVVLGLLLSLPALNAQTPKMVIGSFQGTVTAQGEVGALCWAIASPEATASREAAKFCYVRVPSQGGRAGKWLRSDDGSFTAGLRNVASDPTPKIISWAGRAQVTMTASHQRAIEALLAGQRVPSAEEVRRKLKQSGEPIPDWVSSLEAHDQTLSSRFLSLEALVSHAGAFLDDWLAADPSRAKTRLVPPPAPGSPAQGEEIRKVLAEVSGQTQKEVVAKVESILTAIERVRLVVKILAVLVVLGVSLLIFAPIRQLIQLGRHSLTQELKSPENRADGDADAPGSSEPGTGADEKLIEILKKEGIETGTSDLAANLLSQVRARLAEIAGLGPGDGSIESSLEKIGRCVTAMNLSGFAAPRNLDEAGRLFMAVTSLLGSCKQRLEKIPVAENLSVSSWDDFVTYLDLKSEAITERLNYLDAIVIKLGQLGYGQDQVLQATGQAVSLLQELQKKGISQQTGGFDSARIAVGAELTRLRGENYETSERLWALESVFKDLSQNQETPLEAAKRVTSEPRKALDLLKEVRGLAPQTLLGGISDLVQRLDGAGRRVRDLIPEAPDPIDQSVEALVSKYQESSKELLSQAELHRVLSSYLYLRQDRLEGAEVVRRTADLLRSEKEGPRRILRLGLGAALAAWPEGLDRLYSTSRSDIVNALQPQPIEKELRGLLARLETDEALSTDLENGFASGWLHQLFRVEALLDTYFTDLEPCAVFRDAVKLASGALRVVLQHFDCRVLRLDLLKATPSLSVGEERVCREKDAPPELRRIQEVRDRVRPHLEGDERNFFVDVRSFVWLKGDKENWRFEVVEITPADWRGVGGI